jgi:hypothetical protein
LRLNDDGSEPRAVATRKGNVMGDNETHQRARDSEQQIEDEKGPTEKLRDLEKSEAEQLVPGTEVPGAQSPDSEEIKDEKGPNTE